MKTAAIDPTKARIERELKHTSPLIGCRFDPAGKYLFATAQDFTIQRFDANTGARVEFIGHNSWARGLGFLPGESSQSYTLVSGDYHGKILWWDATTDVDEVDDNPRPIRTIEAHTGFLRALDISPDQQSIATCGNDNLVKLWTIEGKLIRSLAGHDCHVYSVAFHPDGTHLISADLKGIIKDWDLSTGKCVRNMDASPLYLHDTRFLIDIGGVRSLAFGTVDGKVRFAGCGISQVTNSLAGNGNPLAIVFDWVEGKPKQYKPKEAFDGTGWGVAFHPDGYMMCASGGRSGKVFFWKNDDPAAFHNVATRSAARDLALTTAGDRFAIAGANGTAYQYCFTPGVEPGAPKKGPAKKK